MMPLPEGIDAAYVWCILWAGSALAILAALGQVSSDQALHDRARERVGGRLLELNAFLDHQLDVQWQISTKAPIIPDAPALQALRLRVERSAAPLRWLEQRRRAMELSRTAAGFEIMLALLVAGAVFAGIDRTALQVAAIWLYAGGMSMSVGLLVIGLVVGARITSGSDY